MTKFPSMILARRSTYDAMLYLMTEASPGFYAWRVAGAKNDNIQWRDGVWFAKESATRWSVTWKEFSSLEEMNKWYVSTGRVSGGLAFVYDWEEV